MSKKHNSLFQPGKFCSSSSSSRINSLILLIFCSDFGWLVPSVPGSCGQIDSLILPSSSKNAGPDCLRDQLFSLLDREPTRLSRQVWWLYKQGQEKGLWMSRDFTESTELSPPLHLPEAEQFLPLALPSWPHHLFFPLGFHIISESPDLGLHISLQHLVRTSLVLVL